MRFFLRYLSLEGKKSLIAARKSMVKFIVMLLLIAGGVLAVSLVMKDAGVFQTAEIGVVIPEDEAQTKMVAQFISAMDSVKSVCHFQYLNQDKAMASLEKGTLDAVLSLPEQFYEDVDSGKNTPATIYFPENAPLNTRVFGELVADGVSLLRTAEAGVYATYDTAQIYQAEISRDQIGDVISELYIYEAFDRTSVFQKNVYSSLGKADIHQYYFSAAVLLLFLMMGVNYGYLYQKQSRAVEEKIRIYGIGEGKNALIKVLLMTVPLWLVGVLVYAVGCLVSGKYHLSFLWFDREVLPGTLLLAAVIAAYFQLIYTISGESTRGTIVLLAVNVFQIMASGDYWVDFVDVHSGKGNALQKLCNRLGITKREEVVAFGDNCNDVSMLLEAGKSYAVTTAREEAKQAARYVLEKPGPDSVLNVLKMILEL